MNPRRIHPGTASADRPPPSRRLRYRPLECSDESWFVALYGDATTMRHIGAPLSPAAARRALRDCLPESAAAGGPIFLVVEDRADGAALGLVGTPRFVAGDEVEVGVVLGPANGGRGYGRESLAALARWLLGTGAARRLRTEIDHENRAAIAMVEAIGFRRDSPAPDTTAAFWHLDQPPPEDAECRR